jgi:superoxide reductase
MIRPLAMLLTVCCAAALAAAAPAGAETPFSKINRAANDAHTPVIDAPDTVKAGEPFKVTITIGKTPHPSLAEHAVQWIALYADEVELARATLTPVLTRPTVTFTIALDESATLRALEAPNHSAAWEATRKITVTKEEKKQP